MSKPDAARMKEIEDIQEAIRKMIGKIDESFKKKPQIQEGTAA